MTTAATAPTVDELIERVRGLEPLVEEHRARLDEERAIPGEITSELVDAGLFRLFTPAEFGGHQLDPVSGLRVIAEVARLDGSVGWNVMLLASYSASAGRCPANAARAIYEPRDSAVAGQISPAGATARVEDGGYRVNGRWPFGSGSGQATWFVGHCRIEPDGDVEEDAPPRMVWAFTPAANVEIHDTRYTGGLRGTASHEYSMSDVFVPGDFVIDLPPGNPLRDEPLYRYPLRSLLLPGVASVPLGIARSAIDAFIELANEKGVRGGDRTQADRELVQMAVARAENLLGAARALLFESMSALWETVERGAGAGTAGAGERRLRPCGRVLRGGGGPDVRAGWRKLGVREPQVGAMPPRRAYGAAAHRRLGRSASGVGAGVPRRRVPGAGSDDLSSCLGLGMSHSRLWAASIEA